MLEGMLYIAPIVPVEQDPSKPYYGTKEDPYEALKVIYTWGLDFCLGNAVKYICRAGKKPGEDEVKDLEKAVDYLQRKVKFLKEAKR